jgi:mycoredoxin
MKKIIYIAIGLVLAVKLGLLGNHHFSDETEVAGAYENEVVLYATAWCGYCKKTRALLKKHGIAYTEYDIEKSAQGREEYDQLNGKGVPLLVINGKVVRGYDPNQILRLAKGG